MTNTITIVTPSFIDDGIELRVEYFKGRSDIDRTHLYEGDFHTFMKLAETVKYEFA